MIIRYISIDFELSGFNDNLIRFEKIKDKRIGLTVGINEFVKMLSDSDCKILDYGSAGIPVLTNSEIKQICLQEKFLKATINDLIFAIEVKQSKCGIKKKWTNLEMLNCYLAEIL